MFLQHVILGAFFFVMVLVGILSSRRVKTADDYMPGGRKIGSWLSAFPAGQSVFQLSFLSDAPDASAGHLECPPPGSESATPLSADMICLFDRHPLAGQLTGRWSNIPEGAKYL